ARPMAAAGRHIQLDEDPEQAALREAREESGLQVELLGERPPTTGPGTRGLIAPRFLDIHRSLPSPFTQHAARFTFHPGLAPQHDKPLQRKPTPCIAPVLCRSPECRGHRTDKIA